MTNGEENTTTMTETVAEEKKAVVKKEPRRGADGHFMTGRGRPAIKKELKKNHVLQVCFSAGEFEAIEKKAAAAGVSKASKYVYQMVKRNLSK